MAEHDPRQPQNNANHNGNIKKVADMIKGINFAMVTTICEDGSLRSRPVATQKFEFDGDLWFFTYAESGKAHEVEHNPHVNVSYAAPNKQDYVSLTGEASIVRDQTKMKELWSAPLESWFPQGMETPGIALLKVEVTRAEIWDAPSSPIAHVIGLVRSKVTGHAQPTGDNEVLEIRHA